jgi:hypothetical protein
MKDNIEPIDNGPVERKSYTAPAIVHELKLETRAGSPIFGGGGRPDPLDPLGIDPTQPRIN